ncbi:MAG: DUF2845 domain-containing protein [Deltaproteobacteria bacterium]|nr:DUF2845 domain-containing protein [Deltaproteobacteria bacterium]
MKITKTVGFFAATLLLTPAIAWPAYCPHGVFHVGDSVTQVLKRCGEPQHKTVSKIGLSSREEIWHYDFGDKRIPFSVTIRDGKVIKIQND